MQNYLKNKTTLIINASNKQQQPKPRREIKHPQTNESKEATLPMNEKSKTANLDIFLILLVFSFVS